MDIFTLYFASRKSKFSWKIEEFFFLGKRCFISERSEIRLEAIFPSTSSFDFSFLYIFKRVSKTFNWNSNQWSYAYKILSDHLKDLVFLIDYEILFW